MRAGPAACWCHAPLLMDCCTSSCLSWPPCTCASGCRVTCALTTWITAGLASVALLRMQGGSSRTTLRAEQSWWRSSRTSPSNALWRTAQCRLDSSCWNSS